MASITGSGVGFGCSGVCASCCERCVELRRIRLVESLCGWLGLQSSRVGSSAGVCCAAGGGVGVSSCAFAQAVCGGSRCDGPITCAADTCGCGWARVKCSTIVNSGYASDSVYGCGEGTHLCGRTRCEAAKGFPLPEDVKLLRESCCTGFPNGGGDRCGGGCKAGAPDEIPSVGEPIVDAANSEESTVFGVSVATDVCGSGGGHGEDASGLRVNYQPRGPHWSRNNSDRKKKKEKKKQSKEAAARALKDDGFEADPRSRCASSGEKSALRVSLEKKWEVENKLAAVKAERQLAILQLNSVEEEAKKIRTKISADTERNMVSIEKTHAFLKSSGNVPGEFHGSAQTIVEGELPELSSGSGSITPDSSASMAEFRACQKALLDAEDKNRKMVEALKRFGMSEDALLQVDKRTWTDNTHNDDVLDQIYPNGHGGYPVNRDGVIKISLDGPDY